MQETIRSLEEFWALIREVWRTGVLGVDLGTVLGAVGVIALVYILRGLFTRFVIGRLRRWARRSDSDLDDIAIAALQPPLRFIPMVIGLFFIVEIFDPDGRAQFIADNLLRSLVAFTIFWLFFRLVEPIRVLMPRVASVLTEELIDWLIKGLKIAFVFLGAATILEIWGIQVGPILAGLGLIGVAVALGAQDLFRNLIAGILILTEQRFGRGDWVKVDGTAEGTVETIGFRSTLIRQFDKAPIFVPNAKLSDNALINYSRMTHRRIYWMIGVEYRTTVDQLRVIRDGIEAFLREDDAFVKPPETALFVRVDKFADSSIDIMLYTFTHTTVWGEWLAEKERLAYRIKEIVEGAGSSFAFPSRSIYIADGTGETPEPFVPPGAEDDRGRED